MNLLVYYVSLNIMHKKKPHRNAAFVKNQSGSVTPKEN